MEVACASRVPRSSGGAHARHARAGRRAWATLLAGAPWLAAAAAPLAAYNVDPANVSISGMSSGGYVAMQMAVAYSSVFRGVGVVAGGPYDCARQALISECSAGAAPDVSPAVANARGWSGNEIDDVAHIAGQRVYVVDGSLDVVTGPSVARQVQAFYVQGGFLPAARVKVDTVDAAGHTFPTNFDAAGNTACGISAEPFISNCRFDAAGALLQWIHGALKPPAASGAAGRLLSFDQSPFAAPGIGMDTTGLVYVPTRCAAGERCALHVALHGCYQGQSWIGRKFATNSGYARWADANDIIVLFPQAKVDFVPHWTPANGLLNNVEGCWDWIGWYGNDYDQKSGAQLRAIRAMIQQVEGEGTSGASRRRPHAEAPSAPRP